ncbi:hypothetical protein F4780DRAFT_207065 [Xylariomycetidae sp. FL0641]|nr:hypothetical protein F4780DRAFT_207065 [Xylariomycetidae sp. FL0641]
MEEQPEVELLIHIGAPSRAVDDERYRTLATSYLQFGPTPRLSLDDSFPAVDTQRHQLHGELELCSQAHDAPGSSQAHGFLGSLQSPLASFGSVIDNANSPALQAVHHRTWSPGISGPEITQVSQSTWQSAPSTVDDSHPFGHTTLNAFTSPTRVLEHYLQGFNSPSPSRTRSSGASVVVVNNTPPRLLLEAPTIARGGATKPPSTPVIPSTVPATVSFEAPRPVFPKLRGGTDRRHQSSLGLSSQGSMDTDKVIEETTAGFSIEATQTGRADSEPAPSKRPWLPTLSRSAQGLARTASDLGPGTVSQKLLPSSSFLAVHGMKYESLELRAPEPDVSVLSIEPNDFVTPSLRKLARDLDLQNHRFHPKNQTRELRPTERGYWFLECSDWSDQLKRNAWAYLANYIGTGLAGWGICCRRDEGFQYLRLYCWGQVVHHLYLLLYLATERKVLYTGASWVDGGGTSIVIMDRRKIR